MGDGRVTRGVTEAAAKASVTGRATRLEADIAAKGGETVRSTRVQAEVASSDYFGRGQVTTVFVEFACPNDYSAAATRVEATAGVQVEVDGRSTRVEADIGCATTITGRATKAEADVAPLMDIPANVTRVVVEVSYPRDVSTDESQARVTQVHVEFACPYYPATTCENLLGTQALSFQELRRRVLGMLGEDEDAPSLWSVAEVGRLVNDAYGEIVAQSGCVEVVEAFTTTTAVTYSLDTLTLKVHRVLLDDEEIPMATLMEQDHFKPGWGQSGRKPKVYIPTGNRSVTLESPPDAGLSLDVWETRSVDDMSDICDSPDLPDWSHLAVALLAASKGLRKYGEQRDLPLSDAYASMADDYISLLKGLMSRRVA